jgi:hypothetical protein
MIGKDEPRSLELNRQQLQLCRCLLRRGIPAELLGKFLLRVGATAADWEALVTARYVLLDRKGYEWRLTDLGWREFRRQRAGKYF